MADTLLSSLSWTEEPAINLLKWLVRDNILLTSFLDRGSLVVESYGLTTSCWLPSTHPRHRFHSNRKSKVVPGEPFGGATIG